MIDHEERELGDDLYLEPGFPISEGTCGSFCEEEGMPSYLCTRSEKHEGDHAAHTPNSVQLARWPQ